MSQNDKPSDKKPGTQQSQPGKSESAKHQVGAEAAPQTATGSKSPTGKAGKLNLLAFAVAAIAFLFAGYLWLQLNDIKLDQQKVRVAISEESKMLGRRLDQKQEAANKKQDTLAQQVNNLEESVIALRKLAGRGRKGWMLAEVEYLLLIANYRLALENDVKTALYALQEADRRLQQIGDPTLVKARGHVATEINRLKSFNAPDINGMAKRIDALAVQSLSLALNEPNPGQFRNKNRKTEAADAKQGSGGAANVGEKSQKPSASSKQDKDSDGSVSKSLQRIFGELKTLVVIRRRKTPFKPMLLPEQRRIIRQMLQLKLQSMRIALMDGDGERFKASANETITWLQSNFNRENKQVQQTEAELKKLAGTNIKPGMPDISASLKEVRFQLNKDKLTPN